MEENLMKDVIIYTIFRIFVILVKLLPDKLKYYFGKLFGRFAHLVTKKRRKLAKENLAMAFPDQLSEDKVRQIIKEVYENVGLMLVEFIMLQKINHDNFQQYVEVEGQKNLDKAYNQDQGIIIYGAHFGNWEWMAAFISLLGYPLNAIVQKQHNQYFNDYINGIREDKGLNVIPLGVSVRKAYSALKNGECVFILGDQDARDRGWKLNFFGRPASTYNGVIQLAERTGARIVPTFLIRQKRGKHKLIFYPSHRIGQDLSREEQKQKLQELTNIVEEVVRENKSQWFWLHKRWKTY
mgnify:CR=1 FL=1